MYITKLKVFLLCFSLLIFFSSTVQAITKEVIIKVQRSIVLISSNTKEKPPLDTPSSLCAGSVINEEGLVLTNFHCIYGQKTVKLWYWDEDDWHEYDVQVIGEDPLADLAVLKVQGQDRKVPYLKFADKENIYTGAEAFAFGHPMGMVWSLSRGIISNDNRYARHPYIKAIQVDAAINKGNSGGPIINSKGEIMGIASLLVSPTKQNAGVGIAIRGDIAEKSLDTMITTGKVDRPAIGVSIITLFGKDSQRNNIKKKHPDIKTTIPNTYGLLVTTDESGKRPIPKGLKPWDTIIGINDTLINNDVEFSDQLIKYKIGQVITVNVLRDKRFMKVNDIILKILPVPTKLMYGKLLRPPVEPPKE